MRGYTSIIGWVALACCFAAHAIAAEQQAVLKTEWVYEQAPFPQCHASTIAQTPEGLLAAWFGGSREGQKDVGIWLSHNRSGKWSPPVQVANGNSEDGALYPCWNPVLFQQPKGALVLFYKVGPSPDAWWGMRLTSDDAGKTWSKPQRLGRGILGPIKNKPILLNDGSLLCGSSTEHDGWKVHLELTTDLGNTCQKAVPVAGAEQFGAIQPTLLAWPSGKMQILCRSRQRTIVQSWSDDGGKTWAALSRTNLPNPNSGIDAVMLRQGFALLVYNHTLTGRSPLNLAFSKDGIKWTPGPVLETEPGEYSYPAIIQTTDGLVHITYTWKRQRIKHVVIDPAKLPQ
jgi:predicted neuraminidase